MLVVVIGIVLVVVTTDVAAGWVEVEVTTLVVPGAVLRGSGQQTKSQSVLQHERRRKEGRELTKSA